MPYDIRETEKTLNVPGRAPVKEPLENIGSFFGDEIKFSDYWRVIRLNMWAILGLTFMAGLIGALTAVSSQPIYMARARLLVEPEQPKVVSMDPLQAASNIWFFYETQYEIIKSRSVSKAVIDNLDLDNNPEFFRQSEKSVLSLFWWKNMVTQNFDDLMSLDLSGVVPSGLLASKVEMSSKVDLQRENMISYFMKNLTVGGEEKSQIVSISYEAANPVLAADIANAVVAAYVELNLESRLAVAKQAASWLTERLEDLRSKLAESEKALLAFQTKEGVVDTKSSQDIVRRRLANLTQELVKSQIAKAEAGSRYNQVLSAQRDGTNLNSLQPVIQNLLIQRLKEEEARLERRVAELSERYGKKHPKMILAKSDLKEAARRLKGEIRNVVDGIRKEYEVANENEKKLKLLNKRHKTEIRNIRGKEFQLTKLERDVETNRNLYQMFLTRFKETDISENNKITNIRIIDEANPPVKPFKPRKGRIVGFSLFAGLFIGLFIAFLRENLNDTIKNQEDVERKLVLPTLGVIPLLPKEEISDYLADHEQESSSTSMFSEAVNNIRTSVLFSNIDSPPKTILVTSSIPSEGKTTFSCELAISFSKLGSTLLLEADLRKPTVAKAMNLNDKIDVMSLVSGQESIDMLTNNGSSSNLQVITCEQKPPNPLEFISSHKFERTLGILQKHFEYIIIDTPPVLLFSDALVLGRIADAVVMVVKADSTKSSDSKETLKRFRYSNIKPVGVVLSHVNSRGQNGYGGYYYGEYYGYGSKTAKAT